MRQLVPPSSRGGLTAVYADSGGLTAAPDAALVSVPVVAVRNIKKLAAS